MTLERPTGAVERRDQGLALADALLESNRHMGPLPDASHARVKRRLKATVRRKPTRRLLGLRPALVAVLMLLCGAAFGIALDRLVLRRPATVPADAGAAKSGSGAHRGKAKAHPAATDSGKQAAEAPAPATVPAAAEIPPIAKSTAATEPLTPNAPVRVRPAVRRVAVRPELAELAPAETAWPMPAAPVADSPAQVGAQAPATSQARSAPVAAPSAADGVAAAATKPAAASSDGLSEERLLAAAVRSLRAQGDARSALLALDEYRARFPQGRMLVEADVLRVDALLSQGRRQEALATLDRLDVGGMPGGIERQLQRGELRVSAGRWQDAEADFDKLLARATGLSREQAERALWGRAQSRDHLGNPAGAAADANEYLRRFPKGRHAEQVERLAPDHETR